MQTPMILSMIFLFVFPSLKHIGLSAAHVLETMRLYDVVYSLPYIYHYMETAFANTD